MSDCIFCQIALGKSPCYKIYEDEDFLAFLDIFPRVKGHSLVIPKKHYRWVYDVENFGKYWEVVLKVTKAIAKTLKPEFVTYTTYGMDVYHAHIHVMPRYEHQSEDYIPKVQKFSKEEFEKIAKQIRAGF